MTPAEPFSPEELVALRRDMNLDSPWTDNVSDSWPAICARLLATLDRIAPDGLREALWEELRFVKGATDEVIDRIASRLAPPAEPATPTGCTDPDHPGGAFCTETTGLPYCTHYGDDPGKTGEPATVPPTGLDWPTLANVIREVDGNHDLGAGELAERILAHPKVRSVDVLGVDIREVTEATRRFRARFDRE